MDNNLMYLFAAFLITWIVLGVYLWTLNRQVQNLRDEVKMMATEPDDAEVDGGVRQPDGGLVGRSRTQTGACPLASPARRMRWRRSGCGASTFGSGERCWARPHRPQRWIGHRRAVGRALPTACGVGRCAAVVRGLRLGLIRGKVTAARLVGPEACWSTREIPGPAARQPSHGSCSF